MSRQRPLRASIRPLERSGHLRPRVLMADPQTPGARFRAALHDERPLQVVGAVNAYCGLLARRAGFRALYLSGSGVAAASHGLPDLGLITMHDVLEDARRITAATELPLLVDADTGWGGAFLIARGVRALGRAGVAGLHLEDQVHAKRCGHRPGKHLVPVQEMVDRLKAALDAREDSSFIVMARTDAAAVEGLDSAIERADHYVRAGADMIFAEALGDLDGFRRFTKAVGVPVLANLTEFGRTPLLGLRELGDAGVRIVLYPLSAFRALCAAAVRTYDSIRQQGTQREVLDTMQTRDQLYEVLGYHGYERKLDALFQEENPEA